MILHFSSCRIYIHLNLRSDLQAKEVFDSHKYEEGRIESSGKFVILMELIKESMLKGDKMLIFRYRYIFI